MKSTPSKSELSQEGSCFQTHYHLFILLIRLKQIATVYVILPSLSCRLRRFLFWFSKTVGYPYQKLFSPVRTHKPNLSKRQLACVQTQTSPPPGKIMHRVITSRWHMHLQGIPFGWWRYPFDRGGAGRSLLVLSESWEGSWNVLCFCRGT